MIRGVTGPGQGPEKVGGHKYAPKAEIKPLNYDAKKTIKDTYLEPIKKRQGQQLRDLPKDAASANTFAKIRFAA